MSLNAIMGSAITGLQTAQTGIRTVSDNVANVDTPGYIRKIAEQETLVSGGVGSGVTTRQIKLATDRFLQAASFGAAADAGRATAAEGVWNQAQGLFGDPSEDTSFFAAMDQVFAAFATLAGAPTSSAARAGALDKVERFFEQSEIIADELQGLRDQADAKITADITKVNQLLADIDKLNVEISRAKILSNDATAPENKQAQLIDELSTLIDVRVTVRDHGGVVLRASDGFALAGDGAAVLSYDRTGGIGEILVTPPSGGQQQLFTPRPASGEIRGLLDLRNREVPDVALRLSELVSQTADQLNQIHNAHSPVPAPTQMVGRDTGLDATTALTGFTGETTIALLNAGGVLQRRIDIDFDAGTMSVDGGPAAAFTPATFVATLNASMGAMGNAGFANGALTLNGLAGNRLAIQDNAADPSQKTGRGFSAYFGLNDLVRSAGFPHYDTGLTGASPHGFTAGQEITLRLSDANGGRLTDVKVAVPAGGTMNDLLIALNSPTSGVGLYGSFALDSNGQLAFAAPAGSGRVLTVVDDDTRRGGLTGPSMSALFGLGEVTRSGRAGGYSVRSDVAQDPSKLALAQLNLAAPAGGYSLATGDTRGADALARAGQAMTNFDAAGSAGALAQRLSDYAAGLSGHIARKADAAASDREFADAVAAEADARRSSVEGVNLDQELIQLTTYQQAYNASARMIQAVKEMYDVLLTMTQ